MTTNQTKANEGKSANRLINEVSTYLQQHAFNPVNWYPWTDEALEQAIIIDKPIMLSIGYSACHWCHVMEEESFEDKITAQIINENFIPIKVDREERPDLDDIYMAAVQLMTGHGGWPLTVFLTPQQKPFYGGTYFPKEDRQHGQHILPGFKTVLKSVSKAWTNQRHEIESNGEQLTTAIATIAEQQVKSTISTSNDKSIDDNLLVDCAKKILPLFDLTWGGLGRAPKFPQTLCLQMCLQAAAKLKKQNENETADQLLEALNISLDRMAQGGIYDHLAGGFARYSTDEKWLIPHFEKMLYDNALLAEIYLDAFSFTGKDYWKNIACETLDFIAGELMSEEGGFYSSLDADSEGSEGKFYIWKKSEIEKILDSDSESFCHLFGITEKGNFENNENILHLAQYSELEKQSNKIKESKAKLLAHRRKRIHPTRDEKILTSWTSLAISTFVKGYQIVGNDQYLDLAKNAAQFILTKLVINGRLKRSYARGIAKLDAYLDDYAFFCKALIDLSSIDPDPIWLEQALYYGDLMLVHFFELESKDFFYTANDHEKLITRPKNYLDGPIPSATSIAILSLLKLSLITNDQKYEKVAQQVLEKHKISFKKHPSQYASMITTFDFFHASPFSLILVGGANRKTEKDMFLAAYDFYLPYKTVFVKDQEKSYDLRLLLFQQKSIVEDRVAAYICQNYSCQPPITNINELKAILRNY